MRGFQFFVVLFLPIVYFGQSNSFSVISFECDKITRDTKVVLHDTTASSVNFMLLNVHNNPIKSFALELTIYTVNPYRESKIKMEILNLRADSSGCVHIGNYHFVRPIRVKIERLNGRLQDLGFVKISSGHRETFYIKQCE